MKNDSNPIIRSKEVTIDMHICAALSESRSSGEIYFAAIAPDMELTVITLDEAPDILPCFDEDDAYLNIPDSSLLLSYNPAQVLKLAGKHYLTGPVILVRTHMDGEFISLTIDQVLLKEVDLIDRQRDELAIHVGAHQNDRAGQIVLARQFQHYLTGPVILVRTNMDGDFISLTIDQVYLFQKYLMRHSVTLMADGQKLPCICME